MPRFLLPPTLRSRLPFGNKPGNETSLNSPFRVTRRRPLFRPAPGSSYFHPESRWFPSRKLARIIPNASFRFSRVTAQHIFAPLWQLRGVIHFAGTTKSATQQIGNIFRKSSAPRSMISLLSIFHFKSSSVLSSPYKNTGSPKYRAAFNVARIERVNVRRINPPRRVG